MKLSISLAESEVAFVDEYAERVGAPSRSAVMQRALELLRMNDMERAYEEAWDEWASGDDGALWNQANGDGLPDAPR